MSALENQCRPKRSIGFLGLTISHVTLSCNQYLLYNVSHISCASVGGIGGEACYYLPSTNAKYLICQRSNISLHLHIIKIIIKLCRYTLPSIKKYPPWFFTSFLNLNLNVFVQFYFLKSDYL